jgi:hypothetical protein
LRKVREMERNETRAEFAEAMALKAHEMGLKVQPSVRYIARLEDGDIKFPHPPYRRVLVALCRRPLSELGFTLSDHDYSEPPAREPTGPEFIEPAPKRREELSETLRRDFLGLSGAITAGSVSGILESELNQIYVALGHGSGAAGRIDYLESRADDLGVMVAELRPMKSLGLAIAILRSVRTLLEHRQPTRSQARLVSVSAKLSLVVGVEAFNIGKVELAGEWHKAAQFAASDAGDKYLGDIALAQQAFTPLYTGSPNRALSLIGARLESRSLPTPAVAQLWGIKARAHAIMGEKNDFRKSIANGWECLENSEPATIAPGILSFQPANLAFYETTGAVALDDFRGSLDAASRALALFNRAESYDRSLVGLERASALAKAGEITEACRAAKTVMLDPATYYCAPILTYARKFTEAVRGSQSADVREWRELIADLDHAQPEPLLA